MPQSMAMNSTIVPCHNPLHAYTIALLLSKASLPCPTAKDAFDFFHIHFPLVTLKNPL